MASADPFEVPGAAWTRLGYGLVRVRRLLTSAAFVLVLALLGVGAVRWSFGWWSVVLAVGAVVVFAAAWWAVERSVRAWGYAEREDDFVVTRGALWRRIDLVPYGRLQMVDVSAGPVERAFGLSSVRLHTASPTTRSHIPGLAPEEAARLRDRLTRRGEAQAAGL